MPAEYSTFPAATLLRLETVPGADVVVVVVVVSSRKNFRYVAVRWKRAGKEYAAVSPGIKENERQSSRRRGGTREMERIGSERGRRSERARERESRRRATRKNEIGWTRSQGYYYSCGMGGGRARVDGWCPGGW